MVLEYYCNIKQTPTRCTTHNVVHEEPRNSLLAKSKKSVLLSTIHTARLAVVASNQLREGEIFFLSRARCPPLPPLVCCNSSPPWPWPCCRSLRAMNTSATPSRNACSHLKSWPSITVRQSLAAAVVARQVALCRERQGFARARNGFIRAPSFTAERSGARSRVRRH